jgi:hypothetical protein
MQVTCINDLNRPKQIPESKWVKKGEVYTVLYASTMSIQVNKLGFKLKEIELDESCFPYEYFDAERFAVVEANKAKVASEELVAEV